MTQFFIPMKSPPTVTAQEHKVRVVRTREGRHVPQFYDPPELAKARSRLTTELTQHRPAVPYTCGVRLVVKWLFPKGSHPDKAYKTTRPDTDNLNKLLKDCMTAAGFWKDDALVASEVTEKFWSEITGIWIRVEELP